VEVKVRYGTPARPATIQSRADGTLRIAFHEAQRALSPGQSAVFYRNDRVLGGGIIQ
jgi:tRNA-specific 2-thiouridylase